MFNRYVKGSEAHFAMQEAIGTCKDLQENVDEVEDTFETIIEQLDTALCEREEMEEERDQLERDLEDMTEKYETLHAATDLKYLIDLMSKLKLAAEAIDTYATNKLVYLGALNDVQEGDSDSSDGAAGDGSG